MVFLSHSPVRDKHTKLVPDRGRTAEDDGGDRRGVRGWRIVSGEVVDLH